MAIEVTRLPPLEALLNELDALRSNAWVRVSGKAAALDMLRAYLVSTDQRVSNLERMVCEVLAGGLLLGEYGKDLSKFGVEAACKKLNWENDIPGAVALIDEGN